MDLNEIAKAAVSNNELMNKVYDDAFQPTAKNIGKAAGTLSNTLNMLLAPMSWAVYGFDIIDRNVKSKLTEKLNNIPLDKIKEPDANIVIPAYEALRYSLDKESLKDMYINLIASSMIDDKKDSVHPAFVEIIKQLSPADADLLREMFFTTKLQLPKMHIRLQVSASDSTGIDFLHSLLPEKFYSASLTPIGVQCSIDNLERLKLIVPTNVVLNLTDPIALKLGRLDKYEDIKIPEQYTADFSNIYPNLPYLNTIKGSIALTNFGTKFIETVF